MEKWQRSLYQPNLPLGADGTKVTASKAHITLSKEAAKEGMVLLKNNESLLPFQAGTKLALFGKGSFDYVKGGGGSGDVTVAYTTNLYEGFKKLPGKVEVYEALSDYYRKEVEKQYEAGAEPGMTVEPAFPEETAKKARAYTDTAVICISRFSGEGWDRKSSYDKEMDESVQTDPLLEKAERIFPDGDFYLTKEESAMVEQVQQLFPKVAVVMNVGGMVDTDWFAENEKIQAVLMAWQGGMEGGSAAAELLCGVGSPSGKLSDTFAERNKEFYLSSAWFQNHWSYEKCQDYFVNMIDFNKKYFCVSFPYQMSIKSGLLLKEAVEDEMSESSFSDLTFAMENECKWLGATEGGLFQFDDINKTRVIEKAFYAPNLLLNQAAMDVPKKKNGEVRILTADIALMSSRKNDNDATSIFLNCMLPNKSGRYTSNFVYSENVEGMSAQDQALKLRRYFDYFNCDYIGVDCRGVGLPLVDLLMRDMYDPETGETYPAISCCNNQEIASRCSDKNAKKVI